MTTYILEYEQQRLTLDPAIAQSDETLKAVLSVSLPELANASIERLPEQDGVVVLRMAKAAKTKGQGDPLASLDQAASRENPAIALWRELQDVDLGSLEAYQVIEMEQKVAAALAEGEKQADRMMAAMGRLWNAAPAPGPVIL
jgi:hypothetical protein